MSVGAELPQAVTLVKLGGSLITDKSRPLTPRVETIERLAGEIRDSGAEDLVLGHGSGSFGHVAAARHALHRGVVEPGQVEGVTETQVHAHRLHRLVVDSLWKAGVGPFSVAPSSALIAAAGETVAFDAEPLTGALALGLMPVVFGDVVVDRQWGASICSTEQAFEAVVGGLAAFGVAVGRALWVGATDGVFDASGAVVQRIGAANREELLESVGGSAAEDVTGGMRLRLETACRLADHGVSSWIGNGLVPGRLQEALAGAEVPGTTVEASR